jgi:exonuclease V gamma subunit
MKRDIDLIREILLALEDAPEFDAPLNLTIDGYDENEINYHAYLLDQAGLIKAFNFSADESSIWKASHLTWSGHEFLAAAKDDTRWKKTKAIVAKHGGNATFEVIKTLLTEAVKGQIFGN